MTNVVLVDPVLLWHLRGKGLPDAVTVRLLRRAGRGSMIAKRAIERIAGVSIDTPPAVLARMFDNVKRIPEAWERISTHTADIPIGNRLRWNAGMLIDHYGTVPDQVVAVMPGRPVGDLLQHPAIGGTAVARAPSADSPPEPGAILEIDLPPARLTPRFNPSATLRTLRLMRRQLTHDKRRMSSKPRWILRGCMAVSAASLAYFVSVQPLTLANLFQLFFLVPLCALMIDEAFGQTLMRRLFLLTGKRTMDDLDHPAVVTHSLHLAAAPEAEDRA